jgi:hypothetical protein
MVEASNTISLYPSTVLAILAGQQAIKAIKAQLKAQGVKPRDTTALSIRLAADEYLAQHREELVAQAAETVRKERRVGHRRRLCPGRRRASGPAGWRRCGGNRSV